MPTRVLSLRSRVAVLMAVPLAIIVVFAGIATVHRFQAVGDASERRDDAGAVMDASALVAVLQAERGRTVQALAGVGADVAARDEARAATDAALPGFDEAVDRLSGSRAEPFAEVREALGELAALRAGADAGSISASETEAAYSELIDELLVANGTVVQELGLSGHMAHDAAALDAVARIEETVAAERDLLTPALAGVGLATDGRDREVALLARRAELTRLFGQLLAADEDVAALQSTMDELTTPLIGEVRTAALAGSPSGDPVAWYDEMSVLREGVAAIDGEISEHLLGDLDELASSASTQRTLYLLLMLAAVAGMVGAFAVMDRLIRRPLRHLVDEINDVARVRLPEAVSAAIDPNAEPYELYRITGGGTQELEQLAEAFNEAQLQVVGLASDQATIRRNVGEIFANLGRRNQKLIARQLSFIDRLEKREQDPEILENLFRLDHLATRMRRNAESLLVLAGTETPRTWSAPVNVGDAVRAAVAEVEQYERAEIRSMAPAKLRGNIASNVSHLLAELIENGLNFSPPDSVVVISGRLRTDAYVISIIDSGIGIDEEERTTLNNRLASSGATDVAPSRYLGLFVVSRLAARYGISVELLEGESGGTHARVTLPAELLVVEGRSETTGAAAATDEDRDRAEPGGTSRSGSSAKAGSPSKPGSPSNAASSSNGSAGGRPAKRPASSELAPQAEAEVTPEPAAQPEPTAQPDPSPVVVADGGGADDRAGGGADAPNGGGRGGSVSPVSRSGIGGTPRSEEAQTGSKGSGGGAVPSGISTPADAAGGSKLRTRPKRDKQNSPESNGPGSTRRTEVASKAGPQPKDQTASSRGGRSHEQTEEAEVMSSGLRRRAPRKALEDGQPDAADAGEANGSVPTGPAPRRNAADVQNMLSSFRAAQNRAVQRTNPSDTNDDEVTA